MITNLRSRLDHWENCTRPTVAIPTAETGIHACFLRHLRRCSRSSQISVSRFPVKRQWFRTYPLHEVTRILPALSGALFGVSRCAAYLYYSFCFLGTVLGESVSVPYICCSWDFFYDVVCCVIESVTYIVLVFFGRCFVCGCVLLIPFSYFGGKRKWFSVLWKLLRIMRIVLI